MIKRFFHPFPTVLIVILLSLFVSLGYTHINKNYDLKSPNTSFLDDSSSNKKDTLKYPIKDKSQDPLSGEKSSSLDFETPSIFETHLNLDSTLNYYSTYKTINGLKIGVEQKYSLSEYIRESNKLFQKDYFKERSKAQNFLQGESSGLIPNLNIKTPEIIEDIIGGGIDIKPQGSAELIFSYDHNKVENPSWSLRQQRTGQFKFDQKIKLNVRGNIGDKIGLGIGYDTESSFDFDNEIKLRFEGKEDDIVKLLEAGNVTLPIKGTLITGSRSLFGIKTKLQFGKMTVTTVFSQKKSEKKEITLENGAQKTQYSISALEYDDNKHFFLNQYFRNQYEKALERLPVITSGVQITKVEVWVINKTGDHRDVRNIVAFSDLGEVNPWNSHPDNPLPGNFITHKSDFPDNDANTLYENLKSDPAYRENATVSLKLSDLNNAPYNVFNGKDYLKIDNARKLDKNEYSINSQLGYISLNQRLNPGYALAVTYEYTINGARKQIGEFAQDIPPNPSNPNVLFVKMLKSTSSRTDIPMWDLMMKNIYSLGSSQIQSNEFRLEVIYEDDKTGANLNYIPENSETELSNQFLLQVLGLDRLNSQNELSADGVFDFLDGRTILTGPGKIIFPYLEPFGKTLRNKFENDALADKYVFNAIYDSTKVQAEQLKQFDKFYLRGFYLGASGSEISLNAINIPEGSVTVSAGGMQLQENVDYTVDYTLGRVKIINQSVLNSGQPIKISAESNTFFQIQQKSLIGTRLDYRFNEDFNLGSTFLYLKEKPMTQKVNIGDEPLSNVIVGLDGTYRTDSRFLTKMVDKLPLIETKAKSEILLSGEFAQLFPGHPKVIGPNGTSYLDDFEGSEVPYDLRTGAYWVLASTPKGQNNLFPYGGLSNDLKYNYGRARLSWYIIDDMFFRSNSYTPDNIDNDMLSKHSMREVLINEVFRNKQLSNGVPQTLRTFDLAYFPNERGAYNFDANSIDNDGFLENSELNWAGIMRAIETSDFEAANIEYLEFWLMDPYADFPDNPPEGGIIYIHLGNVSEDIIKDGIKTFENGFPEDSQTDTTNSLKTVWGYVPSITPINYAFNNDPESRKYQDIGYDGLSDEQERIFHKNTFLDNLQTRLTTKAYNDIYKDPSGDNYHFFRGDDLDSADANIVDRYKYYINSENNSPVPNAGDKFTSSGSLSPNVEDINNDYTLNEIESYYQYAIKIKPKNDPSMTVGQNNIVDKIHATVKLKDGTSDVVTWYQFKIPVRSYEKRIGQIRDFKSIRFMRLIMSNFNEPVVCRFARLQLVRGDWRKYLYDLNSPSEYTGNDPINTSNFNISTVNIEANGLREPIPYVLPPGIEREVDYSYTELLEQNEQSLSFSTCLSDGEAKAAYKNTSFDLRTYKRLKMFVHAESSQGQELKKGDLSLFIRMGTDFSSNYYEYEIPLDPTDSNVKNNPPEIWKEANEIDIEFQEFFVVKQYRETSSGASINLPFSQMDSKGKGKITVKGNPDLSNVKVIMIGVRNPSKNDPWNPNDIGYSHCGIVWINELRVTDFNEKGGWAAIGRATTKLADFGKITASGNITTVGFGGLEQKLQERSKENSKGFDVQTFLELGKLFPKKASVRIPMYYNYSMQSVRPQYNPLAPDILLETRLKIAKENKEDKDSILHAVESFTERRSINFMNVQKMRKSGGKAHFYDIENFLLSYVYSDMFKRDINTESSFKKSQQFILNYNYTFKQKSITPFKKLSRSKHLKLITDFNVGLLPQAFSFKTQIDRRYSEILYRNTGNTRTIVKPIYDKNFTMKRTFDYRHNLSRSLRFSYNTNIDAYFQEPAGAITGESKEQLMESFMTFGKKKNLNQKVNLTYDVPLRKLPMLNWMSARANYTGSYNWQEAPPTNDSLGNTIQNSQTFQVNSQLNFVSLYSKVPFLKTINRGKSNVDKMRKKKFKKLKEEEKGKTKKVKGTKEKEAEEDGEKEEKMKEDDVDMNEGFVKTIEGVLRVMMSLRNISINYTLNNGTTLPGFSEDPQFIGNNWNLNAPGLPFIVGIQDTNFKWMAGQNGWLSVDPLLSSLYSASSTENITLQANIEPVKGFKINVDMTRREVHNTQGIFNYDENLEQHTLRSPVENGSYSISFWSFPTALKGKWDEEISEVYEQFLNNRFVIAQRLSQDYFGSYVIDDSTHFPKGYSGTSQDVIIPAFLSAYSNQNASTYSINPLRKIPAPNWRLTYNGLGKLDIFKDFVKNININHSYRSTYTISNFTSNLDYSENQSWIRGENLTTEYRIQQITISEQLSPLLGIDINWENNWTSRIEYRASRTIGFSFSNFQMTEVRNRDFTIGIGYRAREIKLPFKVKGKPALLENDLNFRFDFTLKNNRSTSTRLDGKGSESVGGNHMLTIKPVIDYVVNDNLTFRLFFNRNVTKPVISTSYPTAFTNGGFSVRYTLGQ